MHPVIAAMCQSHPHFILFAGGNTASFTFAVGKRKQYSENFSVFIEAEDSESDSIVIRAELCSRYPVNNVRTRRYLEELAKLMEPVGVEVYIEEPRNIGLKSILNNVISSQEKMEEKIAMAAQVYGQLSWTLQSMLPIVTFSWRVQARGGTEVYKKVMPSMLAELTLHGLLDDSVALH